MAMAGDILLTSHDNYIKSSMEFEKEVKNKLSWNKKQWAQVGEAGSRLNKLCNSLRYWKSRLKPALADSSIVITLYNMDKDVKTELLQIITSIEKVDKDIQVRGFSDFRNPRYLCIYFKNKEERDIIQEKFRMLDNNYVIYLSWAFEAKVNVINLKVHWIPMHVELDVIKEALDKYVKCIDEERYILKFMSGREMPSGKAVFKATINQGYEIDTIPHLINIAKMEALITISGRSPLCLNCETLGHISKQCKMRFCVFCDTLKLREHDCELGAGKLLYAAVVKNTAGGDEVVDPDDWGAAIEIKEISQAVIEKSLLDKKISDLEIHIKNMDSEAPVEDSTEKIQRLEKKRKAKELSANSSWPTQNVSDSESCSSESDEGMAVEFTQDENSSCLFSEADALPAKVKDSVANTGQDSKKKKKPTKPEKKEKSSKMTKKCATEEIKPKSDIEQIVLRSYGKPNLMNLRRQQENKKYEKLTGQREFVFKD